MTAVSGRASLATIKSPADIERLFSKSRRFTAPLLSLFCTDTPAGRDPGGRVAFIAGKKLGNAVLRNRCKRVLRASAREAGAPWPGKDVALVARRELVSAPHDEVIRQLRQAVERAGLTS